MLSKTLLAYFLLDLSIIVAAKPQFTVWETPTQPLAPSNDSFYISKPADLASYSVGDLIRIRKAPGNLTAIVNASAAYNLVYRTEDSLGKPLWSFTTLLSPHTPYHHSSSSRYGGSGKGTALLSFQFPYNSVDVDYSMSVLLYGTPSASLVDVTVPLSKGWFVNIPDFEGPYAAAITGSLEGKTVLDSIRAIYSFAKSPKSLTPLNLDASTAKFALWGYSGGSIASGFASEIQSYYGPDLLPQFVGVAMGGMALDFSAFIDLVDNTLFAGLLPIVTLGLTQQFPTSRQYLISILQPSKKDAFLSVLKMSVAEAFIAFSGQNMSSYLLNGSSSLKNPLLTSIFSAHGDLRGKGIPSVPVFAY